MSRPSDKINPITNIVLDAVLHVATIARTASDIDAQAALYIAESAKQVLAWRKGGDRFKTEAYGKACAAAALAALPTPTTNPAARRALVIATSALCAMIHGHDRQARTFASQARNMI